MTNYPFSVRPLSRDEGGGFVVEFPDLPGCLADGDTIKEALKNAEDAKEEWLDACRKLGRPIPSPSYADAVADNYSGKILSRFPKSIHAKLAQQAKLEGVSLNQLILALVAEGLGSRKAH